MSATRVWVTLNGKPTVEVRCSTIFSIERHAAGAPDRFDRAGRPTEVGSPVSNIYIREFTRKKVGRQDLAGDASNAQPDNYYLASRFDVLGAAKGGRAMMPDA
jgi:hypothetical protein